MYFCFIFVILIRFVEKLSWCFSTILLNKLKMILNKYSNTIAMSINLLIGLQIQVLYSWLIFLTQFLKIITFVLYESRKNWQRCVSECVSECLVKNILYYVFWLHVKIFTICIVLVTILTLRRHKLKKVIFFNIKNHKIRFFKQPYYFHVFNT